ncbi:DUF5011 domain-containing protein [Listeria booriae]|uniref:immunoglobulin-like domain-containing protein n=1 Tax=Listeria booriae TaxID=1552123 RepID=UPI0016244E97|nr:immunoglobulin-like domain-containing protein [Listeria booriae]MBC1920465.1 DUF5011 domain-containing protein [Listeria booriae]
MKLNKKSKATLITVGTSVVIASGFTGYAIMNHDSAVAPHKSKPAISAKHKVDPKLGETARKNLDANEKEQLKEIIHETNSGSPLIQENRVAKLTDNEKSQLAKILSEGDNPSILLLDTVPKQTDKSIINLVTKPKEKEVVPIIEPTKPDESQEQEIPTEPEIIIPPKIDPPVEPPIIDPPLIENSIPIIYTENKTIHVGTSFDPMAGVHALDFEDGDISSFVQVTYNGVNTSEEGSYLVMYEVTDKSGGKASKSITVTVINDAPEIFASDKTISIGDNFDPLEGVTASDTEDGDLTSSITILENNLDTSTEGIYQITYIVKDNYGKESSQINIKVTVVNDAPSIQADNLVLHVGELFDPLKGVTASDKQDGDLTSKIEVISNSVDTSAEGEYEVQYSVTDSHNKTVIKTIQIVVVNDAPQIIAEDRTILVGDLFDPLEDVTAQDTEDGDLTAKIEVISNTVDTLTEGEYTVFYSVKDSQDKLTTKVVTITVRGVL